MPLPPPGTIPPVIVPPRVDVAVIGGGSAGLGVARAFVDAGRSVAVLERGRCGRATSDNSLRIIHGGFRYLQTLHVSRVIESLRAAAALRAEFPTLIAPLPCVMPLAARGLKSRYPLECARLFFRSLARLTVGAAPEVRCVDSATIEREVPLLRDRAPNGALVWTDGLMLDPHAVIAAVAERIRAKGGHICEETAVISVGASPDTARVTVASGGARQTLEARLVVNAGGPEVASVSRTDGGTWPTVVGWARAFNVVVRRAFDERYAITLPGEGRLLFAVPRGGDTAIGTGYLLPGAEGETAIPERDIAAFLIEASRALTVPLTLSDVVAVEGGRLPMVGQRGAAPILLGAERIERRGRVVTVVSTKYTTFQEQGRRVAALCRDLGSPA
jgi:glycerol-3-phosphate dehydrogenase